MKKKKIFGPLAQSNEFDTVHSIQCSISHQLESLFDLYIFNFQRVVVMELYKYGSIFCNVIYLIESRNTLCQAKNLMLLTHEKLVPFYYRLIFTS